MTQEQLAYKAGVSVRTIHRIEQLGRANTKTALALAAALGVEVGALFDDRRAS